MKKYLFLIFEFITNSQFFVAFCALLFCAQTYLITGLNPDATVLTVVFFAALFIYNSAQLQLSWNFKSEAPKFSVNIEGEKSHIVICFISLLIVFCLLTTCHFYQVLVFVFTSLLSVFYMMPFSRNGQRIKGLRYNLWLKNIVLSVIWASATVLFPFAGEISIPINNEWLFIFVRHFFFIYAITVVFDIRDVKADKSAGMNTLALNFGDKVTRLIALLILSGFVFFIAVDKNLYSHSGMAIANGLYLSALLSALVILFTNRSRNRHYFFYIVDGTMVIQFLLVLFFTGANF